MANPIWTLATEASVNNVHEDGRAWVGGWRAVSRLSRLSRRGCSFTATLCPVRRDANDSTAQHAHPSVLSLLSPLLLRIPSLDTRIGREDWAWQQCTVGKGMATVQGHANHCKVAIRVPHASQAQETTANDAVAGRAVLACHVPRPRGHDTQASL